jgi:predicted ester cyclase
MITSSQRRLLACLLAGTPTRPPPSWKAEEEMAQHIFSESVKTNGVLVGVAGPWAGSGSGPRAGFPDQSVTIGELFRVGNTVVTRLVRRGTHTGTYGGAAPTGKAVQVRDMAIWHFADRKVAEIWTLQDQFGLLKQIGYLPAGLYVA